MRGYAKRDGLHVLTLEFLGINWFQCCYLVMLFRFVIHIVKIKNETNIPPLIRNYYSPEHCTQCTSRIIFISLVFTRWPRPVAENRYITLCSLPVGPVDSFTTTRLWTCLCTVCGARVLAIPRSQSNMTETAKPKACLLEISSNLTTDIPP